MVSAPGTGAGAQTMRRSQTALMAQRESRDETAGVVKSHTVRLALPAGGLRLEQGGVLHELDVTYELCGTLAPDRSNVVYACHALTGDAHVAGIRPGETDPSGWWEGMIGPGRGIDTRYYCVVCSNMLGGCKGTTGPRSVDPTTGQPYGSRFPEITVGDIVTVQRLLLLHLGIERLTAVIGGSFGGMQALEWAIRYPEAVARCIVVAAAASLNAQALAFDIVGRQAIVQDPDWQNGDYYHNGRKPVQGLARARKLAHITYLSQQLMADKFGRERRPDRVHADAESQAAARRDFRTTFQVESYLDHQGEKFVNRFDANSYLHITRAMDEYDLVERFGSLEQAFAGVQARVLVVALSGDWLFTPEQSEAMVRALVHQRKSVSYCHLQAQSGHDAFLTHIDDLKPVIRAFLPWVGPPPTPGDDHARLDPRRTREYELVLDLVPPGSRVLDLGCGDGRLLQLLAARKGTIGTGVEIDVGLVIKVLDGGSDVLLEDIDDGLAMIPDDSYDVAVLSETLQAMKRPQFVLQEILRVARTAIIAFPNFGCLPVRAQLLLCGRMPKSRNLPFDWYDTPNIHLFTLRDFLGLCAEARIDVQQVRCLADGPFSRLLLGLNLRNLGSNQVIVRIGRPKP